MQLSVVIVSWNAKELLRECLDSLAADLSGPRHEIFVVDNASTDGAQEMVRKGFPNVNLVENRENVGFPRANNQVIPLCRGKYILFLNPDVVVKPGAIKAMTDFMDRHDEYGAVGPKITRPDGSVQMECAGNFPTLIGMFLELTRLSKIYPGSPFFGRWRMTHWDHLDSRDVECLLGASILVKRKILDDIGLMDEHMYVEDIDLCYRLSKAGWKIRYLAEANVVHHDGACRKRSAGFYRHYQIAWHGLWHYFRKNEGPLYALAFRLMTIICSFMGVLAYSANRIPRSLFEAKSTRTEEKDKKALAVFWWSITPSSRFKAKF